MKGTIVRGIIVGLAASAVIWFMLFVTAAIACGAVPDLNRDHHGAPSYALIDARKG